MPKKMFLLDAYALIYRAYYAFIRNPIYNSRGLNTSAILGFTNTLVEVLEKQNPSHIAVVFDPSKPTFRNAIYPEYKANREQMPEDIQRSIPYIMQIIHAFNIPVIQQENYEADDVIGTLAHQAKQEGFQTYMMSADKDYGQLLENDIFLYKPKKPGNEAEILDKNKICEQFNITQPKQIIDIMALMGDKSDNVPGAPGIGEKTAIKLIARYGSIENLYDNINDLKGKQKENLIEYKDQILLSKKLVTIVLNVPIEYNTSDIKRRPPQEKKLITLFQELEFRSLAKRLFQKELADNVKTNALQTSMFQESSSPTENQFSQKTDNLKGKNYHLIDSPEKIDSLVQKLQTLDAFCFDTETTSINPHEAQLVGISFSFKAHQAYFIPCPQNQQKTHAITQILKKALENPNIIKIGQNLKYDIITLNKYNIHVSGELFDTMIAHYLLQPEQRHNLNFLAQKYLNHNPISIEQLIGKKGKNQLSMRSVPTEKLIPYACEDADLTWQLKDMLIKELHDNALWNLAKKIEMPLIHVLIHMEINGVKIHVKELLDYARQLKDELQHMQQEIQHMAGVEFNIDSPKQLGEILFDRLKIVENPKKTKTKQYATSEETLQQLSDKHPIISKVLEYRSIRKLSSAYVESLPKLIHNNTGKIHTSFNQAIASTGRLSSYNPNLQNIPIREERGRRIRKAFIPSNDDCLLMAADYSQIELRIMAHMSEDTNLIKAFQNNQDIHRATAANIFHLDNLEKVTKDQRRKAKTANFGIIYGISAYGLSQRLDISREEARKLIEEYFKNFPGVKKYMDRSIAMAREKGYVQTIWGRKRFLEHINSRNATLRGMAERNAINAPIQGSAADIIKIAMLNIYAELRDQHFSSKLILQVHDELIFDTRKTELNEMKTMVRHKMESACTLTVPLTVEIGAGNNWLEAH